MKSTPIFATLLLCSCVSQPLDELYFEEQPVQPISASTSTIKAWKHYLSISPFSARIRGAHSVDELATLFSNASTELYALGSSEENRLVAPHYDHVRSWLSTATIEQRRVSARIRELNATADLRNSIASDIGGWAFKNDSERIPVSEATGNLIGYLLAEYYRMRSIDSAKRAASRRLFHTAIPLIEKEHELCTRLGVTPPSHLENLIDVLQSEEIAATIVGRWKFRSETSRYTQGKMPPNYINFKNGGQLTIGHDPKIISWELTMSTGSGNVGLRGWSTSGKWKVSGNQLFINLSRSSYRNLIDPEFRLYFQNRNWVRLENSAGKRFKLERL